MTQTFTYTIVTAKDPTNPNEQEAGTFIKDDRLYGKDVLRMFYDENTVAIPPAIVKPKDSNTLTLAVASVAGRQYQVEILKPCTCE